MKRSLGAALLLLAACQSPAPDSTPDAGVSRLV